MLNFGLFFYFCSDLPNFWHVSYKWIGKYFPVFLFCWLSLCFQEIMYAKYVVETKLGFCCFSLNKRTAKKAASKLNVFCIHFFSKTERKPEEKK